MTSNAKQRLPSLRLYNEGGAAASSMRNGSQSLNFHTYSAVHRSRTGAAHEGDHLLTAAQGGKILGDEHA